MNSFRSIIFLMVLILAFGCITQKHEKEPSLNQEPAKANLKGNFSLSGAYALYPLVQQWVDEFMIMHPLVKIEIIKTGTGQGLSDLISKRYQLAMISRSLTDEELNAGIWTVPVAKDGVAPIVNQKNPYLDRILKRGISPDKFVRLFTSESPVTWGEVLDTAINEKVVIYIRADESGAQNVWADFLWKKPEDIKGLKVSGDEEMIKNVQNNYMAMGFCNFSFAFNATTGERIKDIQVIPVDLDFDNIIDRKEIPFINLEKAQRGIWLGIYPKNLCRELSIGSLGKPTDPAIIEFLRYILTEGQVYVKKAGLCQLNNVYIRDAINKLK